MSVKVKLVNEARDEYERLREETKLQTARGIGNSDEIRLPSSINRKAELLKSNPAYGDKIPRKLWPKELAAKYALTNLWRVELTNFWRMLYILKGDEVELLCFVLVISDHRRYDKLFGYKRR
ncbi:hypothetical protein COU36_03630 [Candidatus Micrarchaeota archaeon CG10_big_fil_rev_8_21_14_0_10_59_7]|nr:MAG: hypothetical protein COU36_03630 [Candidatus Micrarchaeota archaeon CG10_big_fil_rev_8_21_14_0_10_59_7]